MKEKYERVLNVLCGLGEGFGMGSYEYHNEPWGYKQGEFFDLLINCWFLKRCMELLILVIEVKKLER